MIEQATDENFVLRHVHDASAELLFTCMTDPVHLSRFWGPVGTSTPQQNIHVDLRPGGAFETTMVNETTGDVHRMRAVYVEVDRPTVLSWRELDSGVLTELTFDDLGDGRTEVTTRQRGLPPHWRTPQARAGWQSALDRFAAYIAGAEAARDADIARGADIALGDRDGRDPELGEGDGGHARARSFLVAGSLAGPFFVASSWIQATLRPGFTPAQQPPSALALGDAGWIQAVTFVVAGLGFAVGALGLRRVLFGRGRVGALFLVAFGVALVAGGLFRMDPAFGFPPGTPPGVGTGVSWHAAIHGALFPSGLLALTAAGWALSRHYKDQGRTACRWAAIVVGPLAVALSTLPNLAGNPQGHFLPLWAGVTLAFLGVSAALFDARRHQGAPSTAARHTMTIAKEDR